MKGRRVGHSLSRERTQVAQEENLTVYRVPLYNRAMKKPQKKATKRAASYRLSDEALAKIAKLAAHHGISQAAVIEMAIRAQARKDGV